MPHAKGIFKVSLNPQPLSDVASAAHLGRMSLDKVFEGDLQGTSKGEMLAMRSDVKGSAGYVAMERVTGMLGARSGGFALMHFGVMNRGTPRLTIEVVPDSGTGDLAGLSGTMTIDIVGKEHFYTMEYALAAQG